MAHRIFAGLLFAAITVLVVLLWRSGGAAARRYALAWAVLAAAQLASGLSNVVLGWPLVAALGHSAGAAAMVGVATSLLARAHAGRAPRQAPLLATRPAQGAA
jgi:cytochrome c oxidase assembly protein subunit 15